MPEDGCKIKPIKTNGGKQEKPISANDGNGFKPFM
jgi:hypothetical protein